MLITCPSCQAKFRFDDVSANGRSGAVRCRSCQGTIHVGAQAHPSYQAGPARTGAPPVRNDETSQMFTLAALVGRATSPAPAPQKTGATPVALKREGSGVIDLNALARAAEERARRARSEPPPSAFAREAAPAEDAPPATSRKLRFIGIAAAAGVLAIIGLIVGVSGGDEPKPRVAAAAQVAAPKAEPTPAPPPAPVAMAAAQDPTSTPSAAAQSPKPGSGAGKWSAPSSGRKSAAAKSAGPRVNMTKVTSGGFTAKSSSPASPAPAKAAKPAPGADPCGCKGNLQCAIKCFK